MPSRPYPGRTTRDLLLPAGSNYLLPPIVPTVADTGFLLNVVLYSVAHDRITAYQRALRSGSIRGFAAEHVLPEVRKHLPRRAAERGLSVEHVLERWQAGYAPYLRFVNTGVHWPNDDRVERVILRHLNDAPTAVLAVLIAPVHVLTEDADLVDNGFGSRAWLPVTQAAGQLGAVDEVALISFTSLTMAANGTAAFVEQVCRSRLLQNLLLVAGGAITALAIAHRRRLPDLWRQYALPLIERAGTVYIEQLGKRRSAARVLMVGAVQPDLVELIHLVSRSLAVAAGPLTATAITQAVQARRLGSSFRETFREVREILTGSPAFVQVGRHGWMLGAPYLATFLTADG